ncbi:MAG: hypothetical protein HY782_02335 [Chloroflexi bacterium]|nr:hypothetical protein [Chloroflexota bacterium]
MKRIPKFSTEQEEIEFWDTHDSTEYIDWDKAARLRPHPSVKSPRDLSPRCPKDGKVLLSRWVDYDIADGEATLHGVRELYCQRGHYKRLARESEQRVKAVESFLRRIENQQVAA